MALATVRSYALNGLEAPEVAVEVHLANGLPSFTLVGLPDTEVKESRDRVRAAIVNAGYDFPRIRITVNLAPADLPKESGRFDLPIAIGILVASHQIPQKGLSSIAFAGELSLSGELRPIRGALAMLLAFSDLPNPPRTFVLPESSAREAILAGSHCEILVANTLQAVCGHLRKEVLLSPPPLNTCATLLDFPDLADVKGQHRAKRALEIAASGQHSLLMLGPPGSGKSMLAARLPSLLPSLDLIAARKSASILSLAGRFQPEQFRQRPFRSPHHTASAVALVGGGCEIYETLRRYINRSDWNRITAFSYNINPFSFH
jgi:magnesium chelatase family protein